MKKLLYIIGTLCCSAGIQADAIIDSNLALGAIFDTSSKKDPFAGKLAGINRDVEATIAQDVKNCQSGHTIKVKKHPYFGNKWEWNFYITGAGKISDSGGRKGGYYEKKGGKLKGIYLNPFSKDAAYHTQFIIKRLDNSTALRLEGPNGVVKCYKLRRIPPCNLEIGGGGLQLPTHFKASAADESQTFGLQEYFELFQDCPLDPKKSE